MGGLIHAAVAGFGGVFDRIEPFRRVVAVLQRFELRHAPESGARPDIRWLAGDIVGTL